MKTKIFTTLFLSLFFVTAEAQDFQSSKEDFLKMARYLSAGSGKWMTPNPNYDSNSPNSTKSIGLWFELRLNENLLNLSIVSYRGDTAHVSSEALWIWHPGEQRIKYLDINMRGIFTDGETYFTSDKVFVTRNFTYFPDGKITFARGQNFMLTKTEHETASLLYENGKWREQARFKWRLTEEGEGYEVIKHY